MCARACVFTCDFACCTASEEAVITASARSVFLSAGCVFCIYLQLLIHQHLFNCRVGAVYAKLARMGLCAGVCAWVGVCDWCVCARACLCVCVCVVHPIPSCCCCHSLDSQLDTPTLSCCQYFVCFHIFLYLFIFFSFFYLLYFIYFPRP